MLNDAGPLTIEAYVAVPKNVQQFSGIVHLAYGVGLWLDWPSVGFTVAVNPVALLEGAYIGDARSHIAAVWQDKELRLFVNGKLQRAKSLSAQPQLKSDESWRLGNKFFGTIDEVRISKSARYSTDFAPANRFEPDADTLALYHCDEGEGEALTDSSGNGRHGKIVGAKWVKADGTPIVAPEAKAPEEIAAQELQAEWATTLKMKVETKSPSGIVMIVIPPGGPALPKPYLLGKYEVTQGEWEQVMGYNPSTFQKGNKAVEGLDTSRFPVEMVSWFDSVEFCNKLSAKEGLKPYYTLQVTKRGKDGMQIEAAEVTILGGSGYHIPTDAEWEHGCLAGTKTKYHFGDSAEELLEYAWFDKNSEQRSHAVGERKPNVFGLFDMHGNVREWNEELLSPTAGGLERVFRGGSWSHPAANCEGNYRRRYNQADRSFAGLRLARGPNVPK